MIEHDVVDLVELVSKSHGTRFVKVGCGHSLSCR